ncbi:MAG: VWA domain-containing protein [Candidatus Dadabacteria bacterium]|nr:MAG: VWA domain-containing protein [Candidatus Dadabacteria bacterium]
MRKWFHMLFFARYLYRSIRLFTYVFFWLTLSLMALRGALAENLLEDVLPRKPLDVVMVIDASGSTRLTDPDKLRIKAAFEFIKRLRSGDRVAIIDFAESTRILRDLRSFSRRDLDAIRRDLEAVGDSGEYTDILSGLRLARSILASDRRSNAKQVVILLSDGKMEPHPRLGTPESHTSRLFAEELPAYTASGISVYTIAFGKYADKRLLEDIAKDTGGMSVYVANPADFTDAFNKIFQSITSPLTEEGVHGETFGKDFSIEDGTREAVFYIKKESSQSPYLISPSGVKVERVSDFDNVHWLEKNGYDIITIIDPEAGVWRVEGLLREDSFAIVLTDLRIVISRDKKYLTEEEPALLSAQFYEGKKPVALSFFTKTIDIGFTITPLDKISEPILRGELNDNGLHGDRRAGDGVFSAEIVIKDQGTYRLDVTAIGPGFKKEASDTIRVKPRLLTLKLERGEDKLEAGAHHDKGHGHESEHSENKEPSAIIIALEREALSLKKKELVLTAKHETEPLVNIPIKSIKKREIKIPVRLLPYDGRYLIYATLRGITSKGTITVRSNVIELEKKERHEEFPKKQEKSFPTAHFLAMFFVILGVGIGITIKIRSLMSSISSDVEATGKYTRDEKLTKLLEEMKERINERFDPEDPRWSVENLEALLSELQTKEETLGADKELSEEPEKESEEGAENTPQEEDQQQGVEDENVSDAQEEGVQATDEGAAVHAEQSQEGALEEAGSEEKKGEEQGDHKQEEEKENSNVEGSSEEEREKNE